MPNKVVALTGATSFSGLWIAKALRDAGWTVHAQTSRGKHEYQGLRAIRYEILESLGVSIAAGLKAEKGDLSTWISEVRPSVWIHHHHFMEQFRSPQYDHQRARQVGIDSLEGVTKALKASGCKGVIFSGTYFEPGEGGLPETAPRTPYALSKHEVWLKLKELLNEMPLSKVVFPNPVGAFENADRLIPQMIKAAQNGVEFKLGSPDSVADQFPISMLALEYAKLSTALLSGKAETVRPTGYTENLKSWVEMVQKELLEKRLKFSPLNITFGTQPGSRFVNQGLPTKIDWSQVWDEYAEWLNRFPSALVSE